jgi:hypothetical protein
MKVGEFAKRARASRMNKKAKFDEAFKRLRRELNLSAAKASPVPQKVNFSSRQQRETLSLFPKS